MHLPHNISQKENVVWSVADFLCIEDDFLKLPGLSETLDDLHRHVGSQVDRESQSWVSRLHNISKLLRALQLVLLQPFLKQLKYHMGFQGFY